MDKVVDQRLVECAKALVEKRSRGGMKVLPEDAIWLAHNKEQAIEEARACILKWLEQEPSDGMIRAPETSRSFSHYSLSAESTNHVYTAMNAQAAREIERG